MSERMHSPTSGTATPSRKKLASIILGTATLLIGAGVGFQFFRANPAASQTAEPESGRATLNSNPTSRVLAKVNNQAITYDVVARECVNRHGKEVLDSMINRLIIQQECDKKGVTVSKAEVEQEVINTAKKFNLPLETWYKMLEAERNISRDQYHDDIIFPMLALKKLAGQQVEVTEEDMQIGFERDYGPRVRARLILVDGNIRQANEIWQKCVDNPDDFERIAREHSADPNTRPLGGVIPPIRRHGTNTQIEEQAFKLKPGEVSPLIQVDKNYVILKCEGTTEPVVTDIRTVWNELYNQLVEEKTQVAVAKVFEGVKDQARVDNFLTNKSTGGKMIQQTSGVAVPAPAQTVKPAAGEMPARPMGNVDAPFGSPTAKAPQGSKTR
ncbi:peptidylprolyl isomerase [Planctomicrobium sp. SH664]|uniref:peptidylprolyl isomerase n=1 Tax=Planctomicrobium sp. SH664 TaxID=3448125 RepID=UPI003F5B7D20